MGAVWHTFRCAKGFVDPMAVNMNPLVLVSVFLLK